VSSPDKVSSHYHGVAHKKGGSRVCGVRKSQVPAGADIRAKKKKKGKFGLYWREKARTGEGGGPTRKSKKKNEGDRGYLSILFPQVIEEGVQGKGKAQAIKASKKREKKSAWGKKGDRRLD